MVVCLLDLRLHKLMPSNCNDIPFLAQQIGMDEDDCARRVTVLLRTDFRALLNSIYQELLSMQTKAIIGAAMTVWKEDSVYIKPQIMIPAVCTDHDIGFNVSTIRAAAEKVFAQRKDDIVYTIGAELRKLEELLRADRIVRELDADVLCFNTDELTRRAILVGNFFDGSFRLRPLLTDDKPSLSSTGITGTFLKLAAHVCREANRPVLFGVCGELGGDPTSIEFLEELGLDFVSCVSDKVDVAKIAAAQAHIKTTYSKF